MRFLLDRFDKNESEGQPNDRYQKENVLRDRTCLKYSWDGTDSKIKQAAEFLISDGKKKHEDEVNGKDIEFDSENKWID